LKKNTNEFMVELDFHGIKIMDLSFADECLAQLIEKEILENHFGETILLVKNLAPVSLENLHAALDYYRKVCCLVVNELSEDITIDRYKNRTGKLSLQNYYILLGSLENNLYDAFKYIIANQKITARDIADSFNLNINTASTRLIKLHQKHLIYRKEEVSSEGRQYIYYSPY